MTGSPSPSQMRAEAQEGALDGLVQKPGLESAVCSQPPTLFSGPRFSNGYVRGWGDRPRMSGQGPLLVPVPQVEGAGHRYKHFRTHRALQTT